MLRSCLVIFLRMVVMSLLWFESSHSRVKLFGHEMVAIPFSTLLSEVFLNQAEKFWGETLSWSCSSAIFQISLVFTFGVVDPSWVLDWDGGTRSCVIKWFRRRRMGRITCYHRLCGMYHIVDKLANLGVICCAKSLLWITFLRGNEDCLFWVECMYS